VPEKTSGVPNGEIKPKVGPMLMLGSEKERDGGIWDAPRVRKTVVSIATRSKHSRKKCPKAAGRTHPGGKKKKSDSGDSNGKRRQKTHQLKKVGRV